MASSSLACAPAQLGVRSKDSTIEEAAALVANAPWTAFEVHHTIQYTYHDTVQVQVLGS